MCLHAHGSLKRSVGTADKTKIKQLYHFVQVSLSQVFAGMRSAQDQHLFTILDWGVANAKLEEVLLRGNALVMLLLFLGAPLPAGQSARFHCYAVHTNEVQDICLEEVVYQVLFCCHIFCLLPDVSKPCAFAGVHQVCQKHRG